VDNLWKSLWITGWVARARAKIDGETSSSPGGSLEATYGLPASSLVSPAP